MNTSLAARPGALSADQMSRQFAAFPGYRGNQSAPAARFAAEATQLWGGPLTPMMSAAACEGRFSNAALACPPTACTGAIELVAGARSQPWRNPDAIENLVCVAGSVDVAFGPELADSIALGLWDMVSLPAGVRHEIRNGGGSPARLVAVLSVAPDGSYDAVFDVSAAPGITDEARTALGVRFDEDKGDAIDPAVLAGRTTRFATLVPYKKDLNRTGGLPPEATMRLSAGSVFPLIVPEGHIGRSRTAPMHGNQGLYISIAECSAGDDGPPPHAHSDTQESFYVLDGSFDICTGFDNESTVPARPNDLFAVPNKVMRTFRNTSGKPARLLVIIQGPDRMQDTVSFSRSIGEEFKVRFGEEIIGKYADIRMTFDAEERLGA
ncbi:cupin domain-containing protein [Variovorax sp. Sphag1AA]|uniref:cupin domain-containing protein n=1 Tax=Variovorax sp. Sphag1AA TaxID=2587027 RepID=UPI0016072736|nr:cupin domain-containing protein [Variovorax sp. Sphag1AA]MBB3178723.1 mannose-6-phosphate isomerase-like protein (cupin superfamily) [Variovorax sp. Sphag1AA]